MSHIPREKLPLTAFSDLRTAELTPQFQGSFEYTVDNTELNTNTVVNTGTVTQGSAMAVVGTGTTTGSTALFQSKRHAKYRAGLGGVQRFTTLHTTPVAGTTQLAGIVDEVGSSEDFKNGLVVGYNGATFNFNRYANDVMVSVPLASWDDPLDGSGPSGQTIDHTKLNIWFIQFGYLGALGPMLWFVGQDNVPYRVHMMPICGTLAEPISHNPNYHYTIFADNGATTSNMVAKCGSYAYFIEGKTKYFELHQPQFSTGKQTKTGVTTETNIVTIRNKSTYASKTNFIDILLELASVGIEAGANNNLGEVRLVRNATIGGSPSYTDVNTSDSVVDYDVAGTTVTGGKTLAIIELAGKNDSDNLNLIPYDIIIAPGETVTFAGASAASAEFRVTPLWKELF